MKSEKYNNLNSRLDKIEEVLNKNLMLKTEKHITNEVAPIIAKVTPIILKNLPLILEALPPFIEALKTDQINDNSEKINILSQLNEVGQKVSEMFKNIKD